jgi:hypothetical protein
MNIYSLNHEKYFRQIMPNKHKIFNRKVNSNINIDVNRRINSGILVSPNSTTHPNRIINFKFQNNPLMNTMDSFGQSNINILKSII